jgi:hypothetical protein
VPQPHATRGPGRHVPDGSVHEDNQHPADLSIKRLRVGVYQIDRSGSCTSCVADVRSVGDISAELRAVRADAATGFQVTGSLCQMDLAVRLLRQDSD